MKLLVQVGNLGSSIIDHLIRPITRANNVESVLLVCRRPGVEIPKIEYHCPPNVISRFAPTAIGYEFLSLLYLSIFRKPASVSGYLLFPHGLIAFVIGKLTGRPIILSLIAGPYELYTKGSFEGFDFRNPPPWYGRLFLKLLKHSAIVTTTGTFTKEFLLRQGIEADKIYPLVNPPNESRFYPASLPKRYDVVAVSSLILIKHIEVLLYAISEVKARYTGIRVCVVGDGPLKEELTKLAASLDLAENVDFVGFQKDVAHYYNSSRVFVHTSEREGFPNVFLEASMCGIPCVVANSGDIMDIARDGWNCIVIPDYRDYKAFAGAILRLLEDHTLYCEISKNALKSVQELSRQEIASTWERILERCHKPRP